MTKTKKRGRIYLSDTGNDLIDNAVNTMIFDMCNVSRKTMGIIMAYIWEHGDHIGTNRELAKLLDRAEPCINSGVTLLREFGLLVQTKKLGNTVLKIDRQRLAKPSPYKVTIVYNRQSAKPPAKVEKIVTKQKQGRCPCCGVEVRQWVGSICRACDLREAINTRRLEVITVIGRV